ncbi:hypothetical protein T492DRAFT_1056395 [Pavlovales sp. CCMP2436]|nr:hypothetical protein T492DRAFT_1056395 [Pavlovales sp. CCMP2436]
MAGLIFFTMACFCFLAAKKLRKIEHEFVAGDREGGSPAPGRPGAMDRMRNALYVLTTPLRSRRKAMGTDESRMAEQVGLGKLAKPGMQLADVPKPDPLDMSRLSIDDLSATPEMLHAQLRQMVRPIGSIPGTSPSDIQHVAAATPATPRGRAFDKRVLPKQTRAVQQLKYVATARRGSAPALMLNVRRSSRVGQSQRLAVASGTFASEASEAFSRPSSAAAATEKPPTRLI